MTKLVQASTSLFVVRHVETTRLDTLVSTRSTRRIRRVVSRHDVTSQVEYGLIQNRPALYSAVWTNFVL